MEDKDELMPLLTSFPLEVQKPEVAPNPMLEPLPKAANPEGPAPEHTITELTYTITEPALTYAPETRPQPAYPELESSISNLPEPHDAGKGQTITNNRFLQIYTRRTNPKLKPRLHLSSKPDSGNKVRSLDSHSKTASGT